LPYTIGIDARKIQDFGIGTYVRNLIRSLAARGLGQAARFRWQRAAEEMETVFREALASPGERMG